MNTIDKMYVVLESSIWNSLHYLLYFTFQQTIVTEGSLYTNVDTEGNSLLLILDRRDDPVTPLLHQVSDN